MKSRPAAVVSAALLATLVGAGLTGCSTKESKETTKAEKPGAASAEIAVDATDSACTLSVAKAGKGTTTFVVTNNGTKVTEFYVYGKNNEVLAEVENISPGLKRTLDVDFAEPGTYQTACKPGMTGDGIRTPLTVSG